jgi:GTP-binding protein
MKIEFLTSLFKIEDYKSYSHPEFAFGGRSNVGKSSLINTLFNCKIARTSKTPGKTQCINFFKVESRYIIADLPGYGYAKVSKEMQVQWKRLIETYIEKSATLKKVFILVDIKRGILDEETMFMEWLDYITIPYQIVFTKVDKVSRNDMAVIRRKYASLTPVYFSSVTGDGKRELLNALENRNVS